jgi:hypothetical protein
MIAKQAANDAIALLVVLISCKQQLTASNEDWKPASAVQLPVPLAVL